MRLKWHGSLALLRGTCILGFHRRQGITAFGALAPKGGGVGNEGGRGHGASGGMKGGRCEKSLHS